MSIDIFMPALSPTMSKGNLVNWIKKEGEYVNAGDVIAEIETDKATMDVESVDDGVLQIIVQEGSKDVLVNTVIARLYEEGEEKLPTNEGRDEEKLSSQSTFVADDTNHVVQNDILHPTVSEGNKEKEEVANSINIVDSQEQDRNSINNSSFASKEDTENQECVNTQKLINQDELTKSRKFISPLAKNLALKKNIDISNIVGSGPRGRIIKSDILNSLSNSIQSKNYIQESEIIEPSNIQKIIAKRLSDSKREAPHFYIKCEIHMDNFLSLREQINKCCETKTTVNDLLVKAVAKSISKFDDINVSWQNNKIIKNSLVDISVAVTTNDGGLVTPVVKNVEQRGIAEIASDLHNLIKKAKDNKLTPDQYAGGCITISNLGMYKIKEFTAIINPPQSCILAIGSIEKKVDIDDNNQYSVVKSMICTASFDHRVVNGHLAARWINELKHIVENPMLLLL